MSQPSLDQQLLTTVQTTLTRYLTSSPIYSLLLSTLELVSVSPDKVTLKLLVLPVHVNSKGVLHGTLSAALVDLVAGLAITAATASSGQSKTGLSTDLHVTYAGSAREGDTLWIEGYAERVGGTLAFTRVRIDKAVPVKEGEEGEGKALVAMGSHTKYVK